MKRITMFAVAAMFVCGIAFGADEPGANYKHLKPMEWMIGTWARDFEVPEDLPAGSPVIAKMGDPVRITITSKWGLNMNVIQTTFPLCN